MQLYPTYIYHIIYLYINIAKLSSYVCVCVCIIVKRAIIIIHFTRLAEIVETHYIINH